MRGSHSHCVPATGGFASALRSASATAFWSLGFVYIYAHALWMLKMHTHEDVQEIIFFVAIKVESLYVHTSR